MAAMAAHTAVAGNAPAPAPTPLVQPVGAPAAAPTPSQQGPQSATQANPWVNSLGMKFVPVPGTNVLFSIWDTRLQDFKVFANATQYKQGGGVWTMSVTQSASGGYSWSFGLDPNATWNHLGFEQGPTYPADAITWNAATAFCAWLTAKEQNAGLIGANQQYRMPTDQEWSTAAGNTTYPWGNAWPPPAGSGNYFDTAATSMLPGTGWPQVPGNDGYSRTSPVGTYPPNQFGLYDMGGNLWQWCQDWYVKSMNSADLLKKYPGLANDGGGQKFKVQRGASWSAYVSDYMLSAYRNYDAPNGCYDNYGFRCVLTTSQ